MQTPPPSTRVTATTRSGLRYSYNKKNPEDTIPPMRDSSANKQSQKSTINQIEDHTSPPVTTPTDTIPLPEQNSTNTTDTTAPIQTVTPKDSDLGEYYCQLLFEDNAFITALDKYITDKLSNKDKDINKQLVDLLQ